MRGQLWLEPADGVLVRRHEELDLNIGLVLGDGGCLVIDTRGDAEQGADLAAAVREVTADPWTVVITHAHFDHCFGTEAFGDCEVWAQRGAHAVLAAEGAAIRSAWAARYRREGRTDRAEAILASEPVLPGKLVDDRAGLTVGGRRIELGWFGPGHTGHDLVVHVPDAGVAFAGDLVENGPGGRYTTESFGPDCSLREWPDALTGLLSLDARVIVPGHGDLVDPPFVAAQRASLTALAGLDRRLESGELSPAEVLAAAPFAHDVTRSAIPASGGA
ncbi:MBL fold metallo-hydrolase [Amycolatopsis antarctica]|uniref:MBL fold metallo-hydrolase n=1 Tax=Amycolatopsis antarctica TaxID=1854586 RepID=A0A263CZH9_9PSEU|nr:MBL fold metallo-hydrolase [Amycolatopsis antarctica]OZM71572.1 MBL fold metallo-hydrolase [Amycolatopsis antarctica]